MVRRMVLTAVAAAGAVGLALLRQRYHRDLAAARARLQVVDREVVPTVFGSVEFAERGAGPTVLVSHGIFHGCDGGLLSVRDLLHGRRVIAPSRFGYLGSAMPDGATPADQADAFVAVLDHLGVGRTDVVGISAGATAALQLALRHPDRVGHLVIVSGNLPGGTTAVAQPAWATWLYADVPMWGLRTLAPSLLARLAGVPRDLTTTAEDDRFVSEMLDSLFPVRPRAAGITFDAVVSNPAVNDCRLEDIAVPTLLVHATDDPLASHEAAVRAAERIPGAVLVSLPSGGHLGLGQTQRTRAAIEDVLAAAVPGQAIGT